MTDVLVIRSVAVRAVNAPLARPIRTAMGELPSAPLVLIDVATEQGVAGRAYIFAYTMAALPALARLVADIGREIVGRPGAPLDRMKDFDRRFRLLGWQGLVGMAVSGLDMALWDAAARHAGVPLAGLLGATPRPIPAYDSYGAIDPKADEGAIRASLDRGFRAIKIKLGDGDFGRDMATAGALRAMLGPNIALMVDYNQSLDPVEARRRIARLAEFDLAWVEEPVKAEDLAGHAEVRLGSPIPIQTGENWWFPRAMADAIAARACDLAMPDLMKIGGVTGWLKAASLAEAASLPMSSHLFVEASAHVLAATPTAHWLEYLDIAGAVLAAPAEIVRGAMTARGPGLGLDWDEAAVRRHAV